MEDRLVTILTDIEEFCCGITKVNLEGLIFIIQDLSYMDYNDWEEWRKSKGYKDWVVDHLTK